MGVKFKRFIAWQVFVLMVMTVLFFPVRYWVADSKVRYGANVNVSFFDDRYIGEAIGWVVCPYLALWASYGVCKAVKWSYVILFKNK